MRRGPGTEAAYRRLTEGRLRSGSGPGLWARAKPGARPGRERPRCRTQCRTRHRPRPRRRRRRARTEQYRGGTSPSPTIEARVGPEGRVCGVWPRVGLRARRRAGRQRGRRARAERHRGGRSPSSLGEARVGRQGTLSRPSAAPLPRSEARPGYYGVAREGSSDSGEGTAPSRKPGTGQESTYVGSARHRPARCMRARRRGLRQARAEADAERRRGGRSLSPPGEVLDPLELLVGPEAHSGGVRPRFSLRVRRRTRLPRRRRAEAEQRKGGHSLSPPDEARVGPGAHSAGV